jgi:hypothetical protein
MGVSRRQAFRLLCRFREGGAAALASRRRGRPNNRQLPESVRATVMAVVREHHADFDHRLKLEFHGSRSTSDAGLLAYRDLDNALGLTNLAGGVLSECRRNRNTRHLLTGLLRQPVFGRLAGYEDINDAERLAHDPVMCAVVGHAGLDRRAASANQMRRFETEWLTGEANLAVLADLSGTWIDRVDARRPQTTIVLDIDSSVSETHGRQEGTAYNSYPSLQADEIGSCPGNVR